MGSGRKEKVATGKSCDKEKSHRASSSERSRSPGPSRRWRQRGRSRIQNRSRSRSPDPLHFQLKALKHVTRGNARRLRKLLRRAKDAAANLKAADSQLRTLLHQACACGHADVVALLLRHGAPAAATDASGDTPAHLAARGGHLEALAELLRAPDAPSLDTVGADGASLRDLMGRALQGGNAAGAGGDPLGRGEEEDEEEREEDDDARWRRRLREEYSDGEEGLSEDGWGAEQLAGRFGDSDDDWADRLWRDMQRRRREAAAASAAAFTADLRAEHARRAAEAAERSRHILREEQVKGAEWRRRTLGAIQEAPSAPPLDLPTARVAYDERWEQLERETAAAAAPPPPLRYWDIPWPLETPTAGPRPDLAPSQPPEAPSADSLRDFLLLGAAGPADVKRRLRAELLRWHPDKFGARFGLRLAAAGPGHRKVALVRVQQLAQVLTQVLGRGGGGEA